VRLTLRTPVRITCAIRPLLNRRQGRSSVVEYGRILPSRALLAAYISTLSPGQHILTGVLVLVVHLGAAALPFLDRPELERATQTSFTGWPSTYEGRTLFPLRSDAPQAQFTDGFPGRIARFTDGEREYLFRYLERPSRSLHAAGDCYKGSGYRVSPLPLHRDDNGELLGCVAATRGDESVRVCERVFNAAGESWYDVSSWFWAALLKQSTGPWWAVTIATPT